MPTPQFVQTHFNIILLSISSSLKWNLAFSFPSHKPLLVLFTNSTKWELQQFLPPCFHHSNNPKATTNCKVSPHVIFRSTFTFWRSQWPRVLKRGSAADGLLGLRFRIPPGAWTSICCVCFMSSGGGLCDELITRPEDSNRVWYVWVYT